MTTDQDNERIYPCVDCGTLRTKAEGGTTFTVCDDCWDKKHSTTRITKTNKPEWKPVNPCEGCECLICLKKKPISGEYCGLPSIYQTSITAQKKLLEYLKETASGGHLQGEYDGFDRDAIGLPELDSMLKDLEGK